MAGKSWAKQKEEKEKADFALEGELKEMGAVSVEDSTKSDPVPDSEFAEVGEETASKEYAVSEAQAIAEAIAAEGVPPSCMNGCPHFEPVPTAGGKFLGYCRRYPPIAIARHYSQFTIINHPLEHDSPPICGEHPSFRKFA